jgi:hypothetical protein
MSRFISVATTCCVTVCPFVAEAALYDEANDGDLGTFESPTPLVLDMGTNTITGAVGPAAGDRYDTFELSLPSGSHLAGIFLDEYATTGTFGDSTSSFFVITDGFANSDEDPIPSVELGVNDIGADLLPPLEAGVPPGQHIAYFGWDEQNSRASYKLRLEVAANPHPARGACGVGAAWASVGALCIFCLAKPLTRGARRAQT